MSSVILSRIGLSFGDRKILDDVDLTLTDTSRCALTGANGSGKSCLMKIAAGLFTPDSGKVNRVGEPRIAYLPQSDIVHSGSSLYSETETAYSYIGEILARKTILEEKLGTASEEDNHHHEWVEEHHYIEETLLRSGYYDREAAIHRVLTGLGFSDADFSSPAESFSSGWQMRIALAKTLLSAPHIVLLDEPTNYLDMEAREWLENYLLNFQGGFCVVSHDRYFLDATVTHTIELFQARLRIYSGTYSAYEKQRAVEVENLLEAYEKQQQEIAKIEDFIQKFRYNASKAKMVQSRVKMLEKIEPIAIPENLKPIHISFPPAPHSGQMVVETEEIIKQYGSHTALNRVSFRLERGEKIAVTGRNGAGKSTLLRILAGRDTDYEGKLRYGTGVAPGYFSQDLLDEMTGPVSIIEHMENTAPTHLVPDLRNMLAAFLFRGDDIYKPVNVLSGGEKSRLALLTLLVHPINLLILDEPTNHLDIHSTDTLLNALSSFDGTLVFVSHNRYFTGKIAEKVLDLQEGSPRLYPGDYDYFLWKKGELESRVNGDIRTQASEQVKQEEDAKEDYDRTKQQKNRRRTLKREEENLLLRMEELEQQIESERGKLNDPDIYSDHRKAADVEKEAERMENELAGLVEDWEQLESEIKSLEQE